MSDSAVSPMIKFLLVDDLEANLMALSGLLEREGLELYKARSGAEALELLLVHDFALAFLDVQMPGMDGFELAQLMRGTARTRHVPIIFVTAGTTDQSRRFQGYDAGAVDFLFKPIEPHILLSKANVFFDVARERQKLRESERLLRNANQELIRTVEELEITRRAAMDRLDEAVEARKVADALRVEAEAATRAKDDFLGVLSHELRTPLNPALLLASALADDPGLPLEVRQDATTIVKGISIQVRLIDDLLDLTRITEGKIRIDPRQVDGHEALRQTVEMVRGELDERRMNLAFSPGASNHEVLADPVRLQQVFWNVLKNAVKFSPDGGTVSVRTFDSPDGGFLTVEISDNGVGIEPEMLGRIFEPFVQESHEGKHRSGGLGLGLAITRNLVTLQKGRISVHSKGRGHGSTFRIELPLATPSSSRTGTPASEEPSSPGTGHRILLVEDHEDTRLSLKRLLEHQGHKVYAVGTAGEARAAADEHECDLVISDLGLPDGDGHTLMAEMRDRHGLPGIAVSGYGTAGDIQKSRTSGFFTHLVKPIHIAELESAMGAVPLRAGGGR